MMPLRRHRDRALTRLGLVSLVCLAMASPPIELATAQRSDATTEAGRNVGRRNIRDALCSAEQITESRLAELREAGFTGIALELRGGSDERQQLEHDAARRIHSAGFTLAYWIEVARNTELAQAHPEWMASVQGHQEWRRLFRDAPRPAQNEVVKAFPWVPIGYREGFAAQHERLAALLTGLPAANRIYLNDLQAAPSACGCGNPLCRWTTDYGPLRTAESLKEDAAARFVDKIKRLRPDSDIVPVWVTECEEQDGAPHGWCAGVGCYRGICWKAYTRQLMPVARSARQLGVLATYRELGRHKAQDTEPFAWIGDAIRSFQSMPPKHGGQAIAAERLIVVLEGWDAENADLQIQQQLAAEAGVRGVVVALTRIDQTWQPRAVSITSE